MIVVVKNRQEKQKNMYLSVDMNHILKITCFRIQIIPQNSQEGLSIFILLSYYAIISYYEKSHI